MLYVCVPVMVIRCVCLLGENIIYNIFWLEASRALSIYMCVKGSNDERRTLLPKVACRAASLRLLFFWDV